MDMDYPSWLGSLGKKEEMSRAAKGLFPARDGWYKTIRSKKKYFAKPMPLAEVLTIYDARIEELNGGPVLKETRLGSDSTTIEALAEAYLAHQWQRHKTGQPRKLSRRTYDDYRSVLGRFIAVVGPNVPAVKVSTTWFSRYMRTIATTAATTRRREIIYITAFFNWAGPGRHSLGFYKEPVKFGPDFRKPDEGKLREGLGGDSTLYTAADFRRALDAAAPSPMLYAMGLLGLNCAYLPEDLVSVPLSAIDLEEGTATFPRGKNGIARKAVLMPETIAALKRYLATRIETPAGAPLFVKPDGTPFSRRREAGPGKRAGHGNALAVYWSKVTGKPLKGLRTTFATEADDAIDQRAVDLVMGHAAKSTRAKHYVKHFANDRLRTVIEQVWQRVGPGTHQPAEGVDPVPAWTLASRCMQARRGTVATLPRRRR